MSAPLSKLMTPQLEKAISAIAPLSLAERQQLLQLLFSGGNFVADSELETLSNQFWQETSLQSLLDEQAPVTVSPASNLAVEFWPEEDSAEDFLTFLRQQRQASLA